jgi:hypothetical protein
LLRRICRPQELPPKHIGRPRIWQRIDQANDTQANLFCTALELDLVHGKLMT